MSSVRASVALTTFAISVGLQSAAYGQIYLPAPPEKKWTESQPLYAPYTGPGFGNADKPQGEPAGGARKKYHDAAGTSAYSSSGNPEATQLGDKPRKPKKSAKPDAAPKQPPVTADGKR